VTRAGTLGKLGINIWMRMNLTVTWFMCDVYTFSHRWHCKEPLALVCWKTWIIQVAIGRSKLNSSVQLHETFTHSKLCVVSEPVQFKPELFVRPQYKYTQFYVTCTASDDGRLYKYIIIMDCVESVAGDSMHADCSCVNWWASVRCGRERNLSLYHHCAEVVHTTSRIVA
jgi:hypothetical protein